MGAGQGDANQTKKVSHRMTLNIAIRKKNADSLTVSSR